MPIFSSSLFTNYNETETYPINPTTYHNPLFSRTITTNDNSEC